MILALLIACGGERAFEVLAAASLEEGLTPALMAFQAQEGVEVVGRFDASSRLVGQLREGASGDVLITADLAWMDAAEPLLVPGSRRIVASNTLVVVTPRGVEPPADAAGLADARFVKVALAGESVPAGRYGEQALRAVGAWDALSARVVRGDSVRSGLRWAEAQEVQAAVVYGTDARVAPTLRVAFTFPAGSHDPIVYPGAILAQGDVARAERFLAFLAADDGARLRRLGFGAPP